MIYEGPAVVRSRSIQFPAGCRVTFDWYVGTRVRVYADDAPALPLFDDRLEFEIPDVTFLAEPIALTVESSPGRSPAFDAVLTVSHAFRGGIDAPITKLIIHVCNLPPGFLEEEDWLRLDMSTGEWKIAIHETQGSAAKYENVRVNGGAAVTHLLTFERARAGSFLHEDVAELQDALRHLMSFAFGRRIAFLLPVGIDSAGDQVFEIWGDPRRHTHTSGTPWYSPHRSTSLRHLWAGLLGRWADPRSRATLKVAIDLYTDAHHGPPLESRLVLAYAGLDMLAWHWLREETDLSRQELKRLKAEGRLRATLQGMGVSTRIPEDLETLGRVFGALDGPKILNTLRNQFAHAKTPERILTMPAPAKLDAWRLALWYFELILFHLCGFTGYYLNRVRPLDRWATETEVPPWLEGEEF